MLIKIYHLLIKAIHDDLAASLIKTFFARALAALGSLFLVLVVGQKYGPSGVGVYALTQAILLGVCVVSLLGMNFSLVRHVGKRPESIEVWDYLKKSVLTVFLFSSFLAVVVYSARHLFGNVFNSSHLIYILPGIALALPAFTLSYLLSGFFKGVGRPATACFLENGAISLLVALVIIFFDLLGFHSLHFLGWSYAIAAWLVFAYGCANVLSWRGRSQFVASLGKQKIKLLEFMISSRDHYVMSLVGLLQSVVGIFIIGIHLSDHDLGLFKASQQVGTLIGFVLIVLNAVLPPRFANLYHIGKTDQLEILARRGALIGTILVAPLVFIGLFYTDFLLNMFGGGFQAASLLFKIIIVAQLINVATGSVNFILTMTGHESLMRNISVFFGLFGVGLFITLPSMFGVVGAVWALALIIVFQNLVALYFVWKKLNIWMLPLPNFIKSLRF